MPSQTCSCGAKYKFPDASVGKRAKCKKCGSVFELTDDADMSPIAIADEPPPPPPMPYGEDGHPDVHRERIVERPQASPVGVSERVSSDNGSDPLVDAPTPAKGYWNSALLALLFPSSPHNLVTFLMLWVCISAGLFVAMIVPFIGILVFIFTMGWYYSYLFAVVGASAGGDEDLPKIGYADDGLWAYGVNCIKWMGSFVVAFAPAAICFMLIYQAMGPQAQFGATADGMNELLSGGPAAWVQASRAELLLLLLIGFGLVAWPMIVLCVALGGFSCFARPDLLIRTVLRSVDGYILTLIMLAVTVALNGLAEDIVRNRIAVGKGAAFLGFLFRGVTIYTDIVLMKLIGLYYCHHKHKFLWSWG